MIHRESSPLAGKTVKIKLGCIHPQIKDFSGSDYRVEDWWDKIAEQSWMDSDGNPACLIYAMRSASVLPLDDEVLYGKIGPFGHLVHLSEIMEMPSKEQILEAANDCPQAKLVLEKLFPEVFKDKWVICRPTAFIQNDLIVIEDPKRKLNIWIENLNNLDIEDCHESVKYKYENEEFWSREK